MNENSILVNIAFAGYFENTVKISFYVKILVYLPMNIKRIAAIRIFYLNFKEET